MPLRIKFPPGERIIVNGAIIENGRNMTTLTIHNTVDIMRRKEIMMEEEAITPARKIYYAIQCGYMFHEHRQQYHDDLMVRLKEYIEIVPGAKILCEKIASLFSEGFVYQALRKSRELITYEDELVKEASEQTALH